MCIRDSRGPVRLYPLQHFPGGKTRKRRHRARDSRPDADADGQSVNMKKRQHRQKNMMFLNAQPQDGRYFCLLYTADQDHGRQA